MNRTPTYWERLTKYSEELPNAFGELDAYARSQPNVTIREAAKASA
jgi:hypothetical protein